LSCCFLASGDRSRARTLIEQIGAEHREELSLNPASKRLWESLLMLP